MAETDKLVDTHLESGVYKGEVRNAAACPDCGHALKGLRRFEHPTAFVILTRCPECGRLCDTDAQPTVSRPNVFGLALLGSLVGTLIALGFLFLFLIGVR